MGRKLDPCSKNNWALNMKTHTCNFKPNAPPANVVEALGKLGNDLTKRDHITTYYSGKARKQPG